MSRPGRNSLILSVCGFVLGIAALGALGFFFFEKPTQPDLTIWDSLWWAMVTATTVGYGDLFPKTMGGRLIALFLMIGGIGTLGLFTASIAAYFVRGNVFERLRLSRFRGHVVICGLGKKGMLLMKAFRGQGRDVVVVEREENRDASAVARSLGAVVILGDAREPSTLREARLTSAGNLIVVCGDDGVNAEVAAHARGLKREAVAGADRCRERVLVCSAHIVDPEL